MAINPDGTLMATSSRDDKVQLRRPPSWATIGEVDHEGEVLSMAFSPDGQRLATGGRGQKALPLWQVPSLRRN